jgi:hypothetical protein
MSAIYPVKCNICGRVGDLSQPGWKILRDFAYIRHACPKCAADTDNYGGSHLHEYRLASKVRAAESKR